MKSSDGAQTSVSPQLVVGIEGEDVNISCISTGTPVPTITWTIDNQSTPYTSESYNRSASIASFGGGSFQIDLAMAISNLLIFDLQYSVDNDVEYTCIGSNTYGDAQATSSATRRLQVLGTHIHTGAVVAKCPLSSL